MVWKQIIGKKQVICVTGGILCFLIAQWVSGIEDRGQQGYLTRNSYGQGEISYELLVGGLYEEMQPMNIQLQERQYKEEEVKVVFEEIMSTIEAEILGENPGLMEVRSNLNLVSWLPEYGVRIRWASADPDIMDSFGQIRAEEISKSGVKIWLTANLMTANYEETYEMEVVLYPPLLSEQEEEAANLAKIIASMDGAHQTEEGLLLPKEYEGKELYYQEQKEAHNELLLVWGVLLAVLCYARDQEEVKNQKKRRSRELMVDYAEIVFKLMVFIGAGMTVFSAWERLVLDYESRLGRGRVKPRVGYEEMYTSYQQIRSGISEGQAYMEFGKRCQLQPYLKLSSLLEQNRKTGTKNLRLLLEAEMADAWEQRKNLAKRLGEEAGTKLLVPLFLMLGIVMVIIMVPAMLSMT